ncbi:MAG: hypothetical protein AUJ82_04750 [Verrucomicrobia bacterium CG1_02_43_26]|nr:MAG: hypothetical protein AUJ82_04750 [Verrucomicrobia bacterium CG1_02_43_26]
MKLKGKKALVTGGSKGIGKSIVRAFLEHGAEVFSFSRSAVDLQILAKEFAQLPGNFFYVKADALLEKDAEAVMKAVQDDLGGLDILVNNLGGVSAFGGVFDLAEQDFRNAFELNVMTLLRFTKQSIPSLKKSKSGKIINISSLSGAQPGYYNPHYSLTKAATVNLSKYFANILSKEGIAVNTICPGPVHSDSWDRSVDHFIQSNKDTMSAEAAKILMESREAEKVPMGRVGEPGDIASLALYLASDDAAWITGSCFHVNGGKLASAF